MEELARKVKAAAVAGWWTILIAAIVVTFQWLMYLFAMSHKPHWVQCAWGPEMSWERMQRMWFMGIFVFKVILWVGIFVTIWLSLWARKLRKYIKAV